ncbi:hypothetical protein SPLC1_S501020 [Arthrospira platensis C1]|nr:hypothetical protein SPLC1_S501020 [Arthrospira platensis C1]
MAVSLIKIRKFEQIWWGVFTKPHPKRYNNPGLITHL